VAGEVGPRNDALEVAAVPVEISADHERPLRRQADEVAAPKPVRLVGLDALIK
jgi:hypothetical protein